MTEAGKKWVAEQEQKHPDDWDSRTHYLSQRSAEFWLHAFCDEVERRAVITAIEQTGDTGDPTQWLDWSDWLAGSFTKLKREFL